MKFTLSALAVALVIPSKNAFTSPSTIQRFGQLPRTLQRSPVYAQNTPSERNEADDEIERLKLMAQKLRAEAALLEAERAEEMARAAEAAFKKFDLNDDGEISVEELKLGLEKEFKTKLPEGRVRKLMDAFDVSGDGALQIDEFAGVSQFRNRLDALAREEKEQALIAAKQAQAEAELAKFAQARLDLLNEKEPTNTEKLLSVLPYLFPLLDSLQFGRFLLVENQDNPFVIALAILYSLYRAVPFSGFVSFLALSILSSNPRINRLIRFNMQQAIFLDIALFFPGLIAAVAALIFSASQSPIPAAVSELSYDVIFGVFLLTVGYAVVSSLLGVTPNKIPLISEAVEQRMPTAEMFDELGRFIPREMGDNKEKKDKDDKKDEK